MNRALLPQLEKVLLAEIRIYEGYNALTELEKKVIAPFDAVKVTDAASRREQFVDEMNRLQAERLSLIQQIFGDNKTKLTILIADCLQGEEKKRFAIIAEKLKRSVTTSQKDTRELGSIAKFGMSMVDGLLSILYSATQHVTKNYTRSGSIQESTTPAGSRAGNVLKRA
jgi:hypothetical protein